VSIERFSYLILAKSFLHYSRPVLGYVIVGNNMDSELYVRLKKKACDQMGIEYEGYHLK